jgi:propionyl-CoA carboxylase alpha chain
MFKKILIANRGEIACRVIATARRMGIAAIAVYSDADRDAPHVELADEAVPIGPSPAAESYLVIEKIVSACKATGAEAVHPGYGFLSEQASFARALEESNIAFIGPNPKAIEAMGDKIESKKLAERAGVATVPGFAGAVRDAAQAADFAETIGYPVMIKAAAGGGGKGMRIARSREEVASNFLRAQSEAMSAFGDGRIFIEKLIENPRHIEVQVLGDKHGNIIHLGERECSIQRRHQKVIEEAPSPFIGAETRAKMAAQAIALAKAVNYDSAGTVEFIVAQDGTFYFLEMNTRLQVEHPVTELITGIDLVEQMIRSAAGEILPMRQAAVKLNGWAIEARVLAEDPERSFFPSAGRLTSCRFPAAGRRDGVTLRIDSGVREGSEISIHYDPLIAKVIAHAADRGAAAEAMAQALDAIVIGGVITNIVFLAAVTSSMRFRAGELSTGFIAQEYPNGFTPPAPGADIAHQLAAAAAAAAHVTNRRNRAITGQSSARRADQSSCERSVLLGKARYDVRTEDAGMGVTVRFEASGHVHLCASGWRPGNPVWDGTVDGKRTVVRLRPILNGYRVERGGAVADALILTRRAADLIALMPKKKAAAGSSMLRSPMPALVKSIEAAPGQAVKCGEPLCVIEAMKMETVLRAGRDVTIKTVNVKPGDSVAADAIIMAFE